MGNSGCNISRILLKTDKSERRLTARTDEQLINNI